MLSNIIFRNYHQCAKLKVNGVRLFIMVSTPIGIRICTYVKQHTRLSRETFYAKNSNSFYLCYSRSFGVLRVIRVQWNIQWNIQHILTHVGTHCAQPRVNECTTSRLTVTTGCSLLENLPCRLLLRSRRDTTDFLPSTSWRHLYQPTFLPYSIRIVHNRIDEIRSPDSTHEIQCLQ